MLFPCLSEVSVQFTMNSFDPIDSFFLVFCDSFLCDTSNAMTSACRGISVLFLLILLEYVGE